MTTKIEAGQKWQHFKGGLYTIICMATMVNSAVPMVVYRSEASGLIFIRQESEFLGQATIEHAPEQWSIVPRYKLVP